MNWNSRFARRAVPMKRSAIRELLKLTQRPEMISFAGGLPAPELFPLEEIRTAMSVVIGREGGRAVQYGETEGLAPLREWIANRHSRPGRRLSRDNVLIVSGAQQALDLIGRVFLDPGDPVMVENPTYLALLTAWRPYGAVFHSAPADCHGVRTSDLAVELSERTRHGRGCPKLIYAIPNFQNPTGVTLGGERRDALVRLARGHAAGIVEDDPYGELRYDGEALESLMDRDARLAPDEGGDTGNVIYVGTFSKVLAPGLRVGWVIAPCGVIEKLVHAKQSVDLHTSTLGQHLVLELIQAGVLARQLPRLRAAYRERRDAMLSALEGAFPPDRGINWSRPAGGMFLMVRLPEGWVADRLLEKSLERRVAFVPGGEFYLNGEGRNTMRLNFSNTPPDRIEEGVRRLAAAVEATAPTSIQAR